MIESRSLILANREKTSYEENHNCGTIAFWIKDRRIYECESSHIRFLLDNTGLFGFKKEDLVEIFRKHKEKIGFEGKAREEIIRSAVKKGWIRVRKYVSPKYYWSIQFDAYEKRKAAVDNFILWASKRAGLKKNDPIALLGYDDGDPQKACTPLSRENAGLSARED